MKILKYISFSLIIISLLSSCRGNFSDKIEITDTSKSNINESEMLLIFLENSSNFVNSESVPALVTASSLNSEKANCLIIDIRKHDDYVAGHIDGAINLKASDIYNYMFDSISAGRFDKIVFVDYNGQDAGLPTSIFRYLGFGNVYALKFGMSSWNKKFAADYWLSKTSNNFASKLETTENPKTQQTSLPNISTGKSTGFDIAKAQSQKIFAEGIENLSISIDELMQNPENYYIINYWDTLRYSIGHLPGAVQYQPDMSLSSKTDLKTLPTDKTIVIYCYSGHHSAQVVGYLKLFGYNVKNLSYGTNSFMYNVMKSNEAIGKAFDATANIMDFSFVEGEKPSLETAVPTNATVIETTTETPQVTVPVKKDTKKSSGGC